MKKKRTIVIICVCMMICVVGYLCVFSLGEQEKKEFFAYDVDVGTHYMFVCYTDRTVTKYTSLRDYNFRLDAGYKEENITIKLNPVEYLYVRLLVEVMRNKDAEDFNIKQGALGTVEFKLRIYGRVIEFPPTTTEPHGVFGALDTFLHEKLIYTQ